MRIIPNSRPSKSLGSSSLQNLHNSSRVAVGHYIAPGEFTSFFGDKTNVALPTFKVSELLRLSYLVAQLQTSSDSSELRTCSKPRRKKFLASRFLLWVRRSLVTFSLRHPFERMIGFFGSSLQPWPLYLLYEFVSRK